MTPSFSVIIATRNRPAPFARALESVLGQSLSNVEIIVINDGSSAAHQSAYRSILNGVDANRVRSFDLIQMPNGHGGSYARNFGAAMGRAPYLCFLDDDDHWMDAKHLERAQAVIYGSGAPVDVYMTNQVALLNGVEQGGPKWLDRLRGILVARGDLPDRRGVHTVTIDDLLRSQGFCHLNTLIVRRGFYEEIGGLEETIRWGEDWDLFFRLIDRAALMKYAPFCVAQHNVPDPTKAANVTTALSKMERYLYLLTVFDRTQRLCQHAAIRAYGRRSKAHTLKSITESLAAADRHVDAAYYAREALWTHPSVKWAAYTAWRTLRALGA